jgi:hypothetical protein
MVDRLTNQDDQGLNEPVERALSLAFGATFGEEPIVEDKVGGGWGSLGRRRGLSGGLKPGKRQGAVGAGAPEAAESRLEPGTVR